MARHYFHCSDGHDLVLDRTGRDISGLAAPRVQAVRIARSMMDALADYGSWEGWSVHIYDGTGEVGVVPFAEAASGRSVGGRRGTRTTRKPAQKTQASKTGSTLSLHAPR